MPGTQSLYDWFLARVLAHARSRTRAARTQAPTHMYAHAWVGGCQTLSQHSLVLMAQTQRLWHFKAGTLPPRGHQATRQTKKRTALSREANRPQERGRPPQVAGQEERPRTQHVEKGSGRTTKPRTGYQRNTATATVMTSCSKQQAANTKHMPKDRTSGHQSHKNILSLDAVNLKTATSTLEKLSVQQYIWHAQRPAPQERRRKLASAARSLPLQ